MNSVAGKLWDGTKKAGLAATATLGILGGELALSPSEKVLAGEPTRVQRQLDDQSNDQYTPSRETQRTESSKLLAANIPSTKVITSKDMSWDQVVDDFAERGLIKESLKADFGYRAKLSFYEINSKEADISGLRKLRTGLLTLLDRGLITEQQATRLLKLPSLMSSIGLINEIYISSIVAKDRVSFTQDSIDDAIELLEEDGLGIKEIATLKHKERMGFENTLIARSAQLLRTENNRVSLLDK